MAERVEHPLRIRKLPSTITEANLMRELQADQSDAAWAHLHATEKRNLHLERRNDLLERQNDLLEGLMMAIRDIVPDNPPEPNSALPDPPGAEPETPGQPDSA